MEEKLKHEKEMAKRGFESTAQLFENMVLVNTQLAPRKEAYGKYIKTDYELRRSGESNKF